MNGQICCLIILQIKKVSTNPFLKNVLIGYTMTYFISLLLGLYIVTVGLVAF